MHACIHIHCKNELVVLTTEWLPWLQTGCPDSGYIMLIAQDNHRGSFPCHLTNRILQLLTTAWGRDCIKEHAMTSIVTTKYLWESHQLLSYFWSVSCSDSLTDDLRVVNSKEWFGLRLLMQLASNTKINHCLLSLSVTRVTTQWLKQQISFLQHVSLYNTRVNWELISVPGPVLQFSHKTEKILSSWKSPTWHWFSLFH